MAPNQETIERVMAEASPEAPPPLTRADADAEEAAMAAKIAASKALDEQVAAAIGEKADVTIDPQEFVSIAGLAAQGREALLDALRKHAEKPKPVYTPPAMTERQLSLREEELEAGRRAVARHAAQQAARPQPVEDRVKEGFTTPVYRPGDVRPDPTIDAPSGVVAGVSRG